MRERTKYSYGSNMSRITPGGEVESFPVKYPIYIDSSLPRRGQVNSLIGPTGLDEHGKYNGTGEIGPITHTITLRESPFLKDSSQGSKNALRHEELHTIQGSDTPPSEQHKIPTDLAHYDDLTGPDLMGNLNYGTSERNLPMGRVTPWVKNMSDMLNAYTRKDK